MNLSRRVEKLEAQKSSDRNPPRTVIRLVSATGEVSQSQEEIDENTQVIALHFVHDDIWNL